MVAIGLVLRSLAQVESTDAATLKKNAYNLYERGQLTESAEAFQAYLGIRPADEQALYDCAILLAQMGRHTEAAEKLEGVHQLDPKNEAAYFKLGVEYVSLGRSEPAASVFADLQQSANPDIAAAAAAAATRLASDMNRRLRTMAEQSVYDLAGKFRYQEVIDAVAELEKHGELSYGMALQRVYAYANLQQYVPALELADALAVKYPKATDLILARAELLLQMGRMKEATTLLEQVTQEKPGSEDAKTAEARLQNINGSSPSSIATGSAPAGSEQQAISVEERIIYSLAEKRQHREVITAIDELEKKRGGLNWNMRMQRLYALQGAGDTSRAVAEAEKMAVEKPDSVELAMLRSDLLFRERRWQEVSVVLQDVRDKHPGTPVAKEADRRLSEIPAVGNLDKWNWGEAYASGDYHGRFGSVVGYGYLRTGTYVPQARWLQPYVSFQFAADTKSGAGAFQTIVADNSVGVYGGIRAQLFSTEYLFLYIQGGGNADLLDRRNDGEWCGDFQAGIYGYKAWGPGVNWKRLTLTDDDADDEEGCCSFDPFWRGDWWVDAGLDFSYYDRFDSWLGYAQVREGLRLAQFGNNVALDAYLMENFAWDVKGVYTDNLFEIGPGLRLVYTPSRNWQVVLRTEWAEGIYFGRDYNNTKGSTGSTYDDFRAGISVGVNW